MRLTKILRQNRGGVAILIGLSATVLFGFVALVIDIGYGLVARNELHNVADAAALAATRELGRIYVGLPEGSQATYVLSGTDGNDVRNEAVNVAAMNFAAGQNVAIDVGDIEIGQWDTTTKTFTVTDNSPDAVRVTARRDGQTNGPISTFFARIIGHDTMTVTANATAALTGLGQLAEGEAEIPVGIDATRFDCSESGGGSDCYCGSKITFHPTGTYEGCGGWTTFDETPSNAATLKKDIIEGLTADPPTYTTPEVTIGEYMEFTGGTVSTALPAFKDLFDKNKVEIEPDIYVWETTALVYEAIDCNNVTGLNKIVGFAKIQITNVEAPPDGQLVEGEILCKKFEDGRGGGANLGVIGSIPSLVQ